jgi:hypothetical protein
MVTVLIIVGILLVIFFEIKIQNKFVRILTVGAVCLAFAAGGLVLGREIGDAVAKNVISERMLDLLEIVDRRMASGNIEGARSFVKEISEQLPSALQDDRKMVELLNKESRDEK